MILRMHEVTVFLVMIGRIDAPEHDKVVIDNSLPVKEIVVEDGQDGNATDC